MDHIGREYRVFPRVPYLKAGFHKDLSTFHPYILEFAVDSLEFLDAKTRDGDL